MAGRVSKFRYKPLNAMRSTVVGLISMTSIAELESEDGSSIGENPKPVPSFINPIVVSGLLPSP